jgi:prepilin-type N-terminal cleavage/methylation domain-containing protein
MRLSAGGGSAFGGQVAGKTALGVRGSEFGVRVKRVLFASRCFWEKAAVQGLPAPLLFSASRTPNPEHRTPVSRRAGLTLIEVLLALVILGTGLVALVTAAGRCISVARQAKNYETARELLAMVEVENPMLLEEEPEDIAGGGSFDEFPGFRWTREIVQEGFEEDGLWRVTTTINWTENKSARNEQVVELIYWPEELGGGSFER